MRVVQMPMVEQQQFLAGLRKGETDAAGITDPGIIRGDHATDAALMKLCIVEREERLERLRCEACCGDHHGAISGW
jgi:hypothetical protein